MVASILIQADPVAHATRVLTVVTAVLAGVTAMLAAATIALVWVTRQGMRKAHEDTEFLITAANEQVTATSAAAAEQISAMQRATESEIAATREAAAHQVAAAQRQIAAGRLPYLIEVLPNGPIYSDMGARNNPNINTASDRRLIPQTILLAFENARTPEEVDPRDVIVRLERGMAFISLSLRNVGRGPASMDEGAITVSGPPWLGQVKTRPRCQPARVPVGETTRLYIVSEYAGLSKMTQDDRWQLRIPYRDFAWEQPVVVQLTIGFVGSDAASGDWFIRSVRHAGIA